MEQIDNKLSNIIYTSGEIINELNDQNETINKIKTNLLNTNKYINISKNLLYSMKSWFYIIDYFDLYKKYINYSTSHIETIELDTFIEPQNTNIIVDDIDDDIDDINDINDNIDDINNNIDEYDKILDKINIIKNRSIYISKTLDKQTEKIKEIDNLNYKTIEKIKKS